jgi:N-hydroxyarylamine O-acetyltransferase
MTGRDINAYLDRIGFTKNVTADDNVLAELHEHHITSIPFENIDVALKRFFPIDLSAIFRKVVMNRRGGYCYELNHLFYQLLSRSGYRCKMISCRMFDGNATPGPDFDHMALIVETSTRWLVDVGAGDLFVRPMNIDRRGMQTDRDRNFAVEITGNEYLLVMYKEHEKVAKYSFGVNPRSITDFEEMSVLKQLDHGSYFVKNLVCTRATSNGRVTLFNNLLKHRENGIVREQLVADGSALRVGLRKHFGLDVDGVEKIDITKFNA